MGPYDNRHLTLDPGLTALALRGLHDRDGHYPFIERFRRRRTRRRLARAASPSPAKAVQAKPAEPAISLWQALFALRTVRAARRSSSAAA